MFARVAWSQFATPQQAQAETGLSFYRERILPSLKTQAGFIGAVLLTNRDTGEGASTTYWESAEAMTASEAMGAAGRAEVAKNFGVVLTDVDRFEVLLQDRAKPVQAGGFVRVNDLQAARAQIDSTLGLIRDSVSTVKSLSGYRAMLVFASRGTGRMLIASAWDTAADRENSNAAISGMRAELAKVAQAQTEIRISLYEGLFAEVSEAAQQSTMAKAGAA
jgi:heme-degrading monooxygenase HmoA